MQCKGPLVTATLANGQADKNAPMVPVPKPKGNETLLYGQSGKKPMNM